LTNLREMMTRYENRARIDPSTGRQEINGRGEMVWDRVPVAQDEAHVLHKVKASSTTSSSTMRLASACRRRR
jgi:hypothetical protein